MAVISVVMSTYNTPVSFLKEAVDSILNQTFRDFEYIIIDDGSNDDSLEYLHSLSDPRIRIIRNEKNIGLTKSLNIGFRAARGKYIARMDSDDISFPERFEKQLAFMEKHPDVIACGAKTIDLDPKKAPVKKVRGRVWEDFENYRVRMLFGNPGPNHSTVFIRRALLNQFHIEYDENLICAQDYGLFASIVQYGKISILPEPLIYYRHHGEQISQKHLEKQIHCAKMVEKKLLTQLLGNVTEEELDMHFRYSGPYYANYYPDLIIDPQSKKWYDQLILANHEKHVYNEKKLKRRIVMVKAKLIKQSFTDEMSIFNKLSLFLRYISFGDAMQTVIYQIGIRIREFLSTVRKIKLKFPGKPERG